LQLYVSFVKLKLIKILMLLGENEKVIWWIGIPLTLIRVDLTHFMSVIWTLKNSLCMPLYFYII